MNDESRIEGKTRTTLTLTLAAMREHNATLHREIRAAIARWETSTGSLITSINVHERATVIGSNRAPDVDAHRLAIEHAYKLGDIVLDVSEP